jgi:sugar lactone lactonase YvrE
MAPYIYRTLVFLLALLPASAQNAGNPAGQRHAVRLLADGTVWTAPNAANAGLASYRQVPSLPAVQAIAAGSSFTLALDVAGNVWWWSGDPANGLPKQLADTRRATWITVKADQPFAGNESESWPLAVPRAAHTPARAAVTLSAPAVFAPPTSGSGTFQITADQAWTVTTTDPWLTVSPTSGTGTQTVTYSFGANPNANARRATIVVSGKTLLVTQTSLSGAYNQWGIFGDNTARVIAGRYNFPIGSGDGGPALQATFHPPTQLAIDGNGAIFFPTDPFNPASVRRIDGATGIITSITGAGGGGVAVDPSGNLYVSDTLNHRINKVAAGTGTIAALAGTGAAGFSGDGGPATAAQLSAPGAIILDAAGNVYFTDSSNKRIRRIDSTTGNISTLTGTGIAGFSGDGGPAANAQLTSVLAMAFDSLGNLLFTDDLRIRKIFAGTNSIATIAGNGTQGFSPDGVDAVSSQFYQPTGLAVDVENNVYIADKMNCRVRVIFAATNKLGTVAGDGATAIPGDGASVSVCPVSLAADVLGDIYIGDYYANSVGRIFFLDRSTPTITLGAAGNFHATTATAGSVTVTATPAGAPWFAAASDTWLTLSAPGGTGSGTLTYTFTQNLSPTPRSTTIRIGSQTFLVRQSGAAITLAPAALTLGPAASSGTVNLTTTPAVPWTAQSSDTWLTISSATGTGNQTLTYTVTTNPGTTARTATLLIAGKVVPVVQAASNGSYSPWGPSSTGTIRTISGIGAVGFSNDNIPATSAANNGPQGIAVNANGTVFFADFTNSQLAIVQPRLRKVTPATGIITTASGKGFAGFSGDNGPATSAQISGVVGVAVDKQGNIYFADSYYNYRIRKIDAISGTITTVAGNGTRGFGGDGGVATAAALNDPNGVAVDAAGNLLFADSFNNRIRRVDAITGIITTIAGSGPFGLAGGGDGGPAELASFSNPRGIAVDADDNIFISDTGKHSIRRIDATTGIITTIAGTGDAGLEGDGGPALAAKLWSPYGITADANGNVYFADTFNHRVRRINTTTGIITTVAGTTRGDSGDGGAAITAKLNYPYFVAVDNLGSLYITDHSNYRIRYIDFASPTVTLTPGAQSIQIATQPAGAYWSATSSAPWLTLSAASGSGDATLTYTTTPNPGTTARFATITVNGASTVISQPAPAVTLSAASALLAPAAASASFTLTVSNNAAWTATSTDTWLTITTPTGNGTATVSYSVTANTGTAARTATILVAGKLFTVTQSASNGANTPWGVTANGAITTIAGTGVAGSTGDGGAAILARTNTPAGIAIDTNGNVYFADTGNHRIRKITASTRVISTVAGSGAIGFSGDGGLASFAQINAPSGVAVDPAGNLYIADRGNHRIRRVDAVTGLISTIAGTGIAGPSGDGALATNAWLASPSSLAVDPAGNLYVADTNNNRIRRIDAATNIITTIDSNLNAPSGVSLDPAGNLYIADTNNGRIRKWTSSTGITTTVAGTGSPGYNGDAGVATAIQLYTPVSVAADATGNFYIAESLNNRIRKVTPNGTISTIVGNGNGAVISQPQGVAVDGNGSLYFSDSGNNRILFIDYTTPPTVPLAPTLAAATPSTTTAATTQTFTLTARDGNGFTDISRIYFLLANGTTIAANSCHGYYDRVLNTTSLYNNDLTGFGTNSQCAITAAATVSGSDLQYTLTITRQGAYASGSLTLSAWIVDATGLGTGWLTASTWNTGAQQPPTLASATPATTNTATQAFTITARDANGAADINRIYFLLNSNTNIPTNTCHGFYDRVLNATYLYNDALTSFGTNSQCAITATATTTSATDIQYTLTITRQGADANGNLNLYTWITDNANTGTGWLPIATWALGTQQPPVLASATPSAPTTATQTFTITARDPNGATDINRIYFLVNPNTNIPANTCHGFYDRTLNTTFLYNNALTGFGTNSQCAVTATATTTSATDIQYTLTITRQGAYATGSLNVYTWITDNAATGTGWLPIATWNIGNQQPPTLLSATPATSTNLTQTFTITANDPNGATDINRIYFFLVNPDTSIPTYTCHGFYDRALNTTYLYNDSLTGFGGNTQCSVSATAATLSPNSIQLALTITRSSTYSIGNLNVYTWITDSANTGTGWLPIATWNVGPQQPPALVSVTPISTTTTTQTFTITANDRNGATDLNRIYFLLDTSRNIPTNTCHGFYDRATNTVSVYNDTLTALGTNSQCTVTGTATQTSSTDIQLNLTITRKGPYATGAKTLYPWVTDNQNAGTGWVPSATWTL